MPGDSTCTLHPRHMDKPTIEWVGMKGARAICMPAIHFSFFEALCSPASLVWLSHALSHVLVLTSWLSDVVWLRCRPWTVTHEKQAIHRGQFTRFKLTWEREEPWDLTKGFEMLDWRCMWCSFDIILALAPHAWSSNGTERHKTVQLLLKLRISKLFRWRINSTLALQWWPM